MASKPEPSSDWMRPNLDLQPKRELPKADRERQTLFNESILEMSKEYIYASSTGIVLHTASEPSDRFNAMK